MKLPRHVRESARMMGLEDDFDERDLRRAYLRGCKKLAPDKGGSKEKFQELQRAHAILRSHAVKAGCDGDSAALDQRVDDLKQTSLPDLPRKYNSANAAYESMYGDPILRMHGYGEWLKQDVPDQLRPPERIAPNRLNETFERIQEKRQRLVVSTHVVSPLMAHGTVGAPIEDNVEDFTDTAKGMLDLQRAYG